MEHKITESTGEKYQTVQIVFNEFDINSDMSNVVMGVYSNGRGFMSCRTKMGVSWTIPIPFMEKGVWQYVDKQGLAQTE